jgi:hypothetical protein
MALACAVDGTEHPETAKFCMACGRPLAAPPAAAAGEEQWVYAERTIPLHVSGSSLHHALVAAMAAYDQGLR